MGELSQPEGAPAVVLCCAEEDKAALVGVVGALRDGGYQPEFLVGVDLDTTVLGKAVDANAGEGVYLVCQSADLDAFQARRLEGMFSARSGPQHACVRVSLDTLAGEIVSSVDNAIAELREGKSAPGRGESSGLRDVVGRTNLSAVQGGGPIGDREGLAREFFRDMVETEAGAHAPGSRAPSPRATPTSAGDSDPRATPRDAPRADRSTRASAELGAAPSEESVPVAVAHPDTDELNIDVEDDEVAVTSVAPVAATAEKRSYAPLLLGLLALAGIGGAGIWMATGPHDGSATVAARPATKQTAPRPATKAAPTPEPVVPTLAAVEGPDDPAAPPEEPVAEPSQEATVEPAEPEPAEPEPAAPEPPEPVVEPAAQAPPAAEPAGDLDEAALIEKALAAEEIGDYRGMLYHVPSMGDVMWSRAAGRCSAKKHGVSKFRLARVGDLKKLKKAGRLPEGQFWSRTWTDESGDEVYVMDTTRGDVVAYLKEEPNARPLCVRKR